MSRLLLFDFDSTLVTIEGLDVLASKLPPDGHAAIEALTEAAMGGTLDFAASFSKRLEILRPSRADCDWVAEQYMAAISPGAVDAIRELARDGWTFAVVSGGLRASIHPIARHLFAGVNFEGVFANDVDFENDSGNAEEASAGAFGGVAAGSMVSLGLTKSSVADDFRRRGGFSTICLLGDGANDAEAAASVDIFLCYTGVARRPAVVARAAAEVTSFADLAQTLRGLSAPDPMKTSRT